MKDKGKLLYAAVLSIFTSVDILTLMGEKISGNFATVYALLFMIIVIKVINNTLPSWVWRRGYALIGLSAAIYMFLYIIGYGKDIWKPIDCIISMYVWVASLYYMGSYVEPEHNEEEDIVETEE